MFNIIIIGAEDTANYDFFKQKAIYYLQDKAKSGEHITILTTGDEYVDAFAKRFGIDVKFFVTDWKNYGKEALKQRNENMIKEANAIVFFQNNKKDFQMLYNLAVQNNIPARIVNVPQEEPNSTSSKPQDPHE